MPPQSLRTKTLTKVNEAQSSVAKLQDPYNRPKRLEEVVLSSGNFSSGICRSHLNLPLLKRVPRGNEQHQRGGAVPNCTHA